MQTQDAVDLVRQAVLITLTLSTPALVAGLVVGLVIGLLQALTQIQEQTVAFVPKIVAMVVAITVTLPWMVAQMSQYVIELFTRIPDTL